MTDHHSSAAIASPMTVDTSGTLPNTSQEITPENSDAAATPAVLSPKAIMTALILAVAQSLIFTWPMTVIKRVFVIVLLLGEVKVQNIVELTGVCQDTVYKWKNYLGSITSADQVKSVLVSRPNQKKNPSGKLLTVEEQILAELEGRNFSTLREIADWIKDTLGIEASLSHIAQFLHDHGYRKLKNGSLPAKADPKKQRDFYNDVLRPLMRRARKGLALLFFADASHFVIGNDYNGSTWCRERRIVQTLSGRSRYNVLGAIDFVSKKILTVTNSTDDAIKYISSIQVMELIDKIAAYAKEAGLPAFVVLDNARYQRCTAVKEHAAKCRVTLIYLPSYSPNLNLIERYWKFVKSQLRTKYFADFPSFCARIDEIIADSATKYKSRIDSLIGERVQLFDDLEKVTDATYSKPKKKEPEAAA